MMYKGHKGLMLGVSGDVLDEFFCTLEAQIHTDRIIFLMDMKMSVARKIMGKRKDRAIIILQSHRTWVMSSYISTGRNGSPFISGRTLSHPSQ